MIELRIDIKKKNLSASSAHNNEIRIQMLERDSNLSSSLVSNNEIRIQMLERDPNLSSSLDHNIDIKKKNLSSSLVHNNEIRVQMLERGSDGKTPIKGVDFMTPEDINEIVREVHFDAGIEAAKIEDIKRLF